MLMFVVRLDEDNPQATARKRDPTMPAQMHGNAPSGGAIIDKSLQEEDAETLGRVNSVTQRHK